MVRNARASRYSTHFIGRGLGRVWGAFEHDHEIAAFRSGRPGGRSNPGRWARHRQGFGRSRRPCLLHGPQRCGRRQGVDRPETIDETAALIEQAGGRAIAVRVDHTREEEVANVTARVQSEAGRLDVLVNSIWGADPMIDWSRRFWEVDLANIRAYLDQTLIRHMITCRHVAPLMVEANSGGPGPRGRGDARMSVGRRDAATPGGSRSVSAQRRRCRRWRRCRGRRARVVLSTFLTTCAEGDRLSLEPGRRRVEA